MADGGEVPKFDDLPAGPPPEIPKFDDLPTSEEPTQNASAQVPKFDDLPAEGTKPKETQLAKEAPSDLVEQAKTAAEGFSQGMLGGIAKAIEVKSGISTLPEIEKREQDYPKTHTGSKIGGLTASWVGGPLEKISASVGSRVLGNMLAGVSYAASDNISKAMLGLPGGDVKTAAASTLLDGGIDGMMNVLTEGLFSAAGSGAKLLQSEKIVRSAENAMLDLAKKPINKIAELTIPVYSKVTGKSLPEFATYELIKKHLEPTIQKVVGRHLDKANAYVGDAVLNALAKTDFMGVPAVIKYAQKVARGTESATKAIEPLFKAGAHEVAGPSKEMVNDSIIEWMNNGGADGELLNQSAEQPPAFASGGEIKPQPSNAFAAAYPAENMLLNETRGRVSNYLNSLRPAANNPKLPFDSESPQTEKKRSYKNAVSIAGNPLSILNHVNKGTLTPDLMTHFTQMYPDVHQLLSSKMIERITKAQLSGEKPEYRKRQAMSLFLGANLDSSFTPAALMAIQGMYAMNKAGKQQQVPQNNKKGTSALAKSSSQFQTEAQSRERRLQNQKA